MVYHGLEHERRQPEEVIRFAQYIARPPRIVFSEAVDRQDAHILDDLTVSSVRTVTLNPYWRPEVVEAGLEHLIDDANSLATAAGMDAHARQHPPVPPRARRAPKQWAHMYWPVVTFGLFIVGLVLVAVFAGFQWWGAR